jgi:hypothetical protein
LAYKQKLNEAENLLSGTDTLVYLPEASVTEEIFLYLLAARKWSRVCQQVFNVGWVAVGLQENGIFFET